MLWTTLLRSPLLYLSTALLLSLTALAFSHQTVKTLKAEKAIAVQQVASLTGTLVVSNRIAAQCDAATKAAKAISDDQKTQLDAAAARATTLAKQIATTRALLRAKEDTDHALPDCEALLRADLGICPGYADGVRFRAGALPGSDNRGAGPSADANRPAADAGLRTTL